MYIRLAFATAIASSPDILIVDEALSVGDAVFQHRCTHRIKEMQESGTTILFVSHDPGAIRALCSRAILLNGGRMEADGAPADVLDRYQKVIMDREAAWAEGQLAISSTRRAKGDQPTPETLETATPQFISPRKRRRRDRPCRAAERHASPGETRGNGRSGTRPCARRIS